METMTRATLEPPPAHARTPEATGAVPHVPIRAPFSRRLKHARGGHVSRRGVALSVGVHLLLALVVWLAPVRRSAQPGDAPRPGAPSDAVSYVDIGAWPGDEGGAGGAPQAAAGAEQVAAPVRADTASGAAPELGDGRLVVRPEAARETPLSDNDRVRARIARSLGAYNDSIAEEARRRHRAENWTIKDRQGREWGIGKCGAPVIAGRRIPTCTTPPVGRSRESELHDAEVRRQRGEIDRQGETQDIDQNMRERTRATRERMDREREQRRRERAPGNP